MGFLELEVPVTDGNGERVVATLTLAFPDSLAGTDVHALLAATSGTETVILPRGRLRPLEADFVEGLRAFAKGTNLGRADSLWSRLRGRKLEPHLQSAFTVNTGFLLCLRGDAHGAESIWMREWRAGVLAEEAAWRNLLGLYLAQRRYAAASRLVDVVLKKQPRNAVAAVAKSSLLRELRPDSEREAFLRSKSSPADSMPYIQLEYGEWLETRGFYQDAVKFLDFGLAVLPGEGRGWRVLAEAQYHLGYYYFALNCLQNAERSGYHRTDLYELYAKVLRGCCMGEADSRAEQSRKAVEHILEEGLPRDFHSRSMAQLLYHIYSQNLKPDAADQLRKTLWFHFEGPPQIAPVLGYDQWTRAGLDAQGLRIRFGFYDFFWVTALRDSDFYQAAL